jgi:hypothetical protein
MGHAKAACDGCGKTVGERERARGLVHPRRDPREFCTECRKLYWPLPSPTLPVAGPVSVK